MRKAVGFMLLAALMVSLVASHALATPTVTAGVTVLNPRDRGNFYRHSTSSWVAFGDPVLPRYTYDIDNSAWVTGYWAYTGGDPTLKANWAIQTPTGHRGDEDVSLFNISAQPDFGFNVMTQEVTGMVSDLELLAYSMDDGTHYQPWVVIAGDQKVDMALGAYGRHALTDDHGPDVTGTNAGGIVQMYFDTPDNVSRTHLGLDRDRSPTDVDGTYDNSDAMLLVGTASETAMDTAGDFTDGTLLLVGALAELPDSLSPFSESGHVLTAQFGDAGTGTLVQAIDHFNVTDAGAPPDDSSDVGTGHAYANVLAGDWAEALVLSDYFGLYLDVELDFDLNTDDRELFMVGSDDPLKFYAYVIPEPATIGLFSLGIAGLIGLRRKKSK